MDRTPASEPYPPVPPVPQPAATRSRGPSAALIVFGIGGALVAIGGLIPRAEMTIGPLVVQTKGIALGLLLIGCLMVFRAFQVAARGGGRGGAAILFVGPVVALGLVIFEMATVKNDLTHWATTTGANQIATQYNVSATTVAARIQGFIDAGQSHVTYKAGLWLALIGGLISLGAAFAARFTGGGGGEAQVATGPGWVAPGAPIPAPAPRARDAGLPADWTAPPSGWTDPASSTPAAPPSAPPPAQPATPPPQAAPPEEPESFPPPPPPPPPS
jgi:hypothetical protein